jgi:hypothetical protein
MDQLLRDARLLDFHATYVLVVIGIGVAVTALLVWAEVWGRARARRRTAQAIAQAQRLDSFKART